MKLKGQYHGFTAHPKMRELQNIIFCDRLWYNCKQKVNYSDGNNNLLEPRDLLKNI
jgi:predicted aldo/keto reductase-like oxidoreductase